MARGVYIVGLKDKSYVNWAVNLAASVKLYSPDLFITFLHDGCFTSIPPEEQAIFDKAVIVNEEHYTDNKEFQPGKFKLHLYEYFEHEENIFIDADSILIKDILPLFDSMQGQDIGLQVVKSYSHESTGWDCIWMDWDRMKNTYSLPDEFTIHEINSSIIYSKKNNKAAKFWTQAQKNYISEYKSKWGNKFPDELAFNLATAQIKGEYKIPNCTGETPVNMNGKETINKLKEKCYILSYWGGKHHEYAKHYMNYDLQAQHVHRTILGKHNPYKIHLLMKRKMVQVAGVRLEPKKDIDSVATRLKTELSQFTPHIKISDTLLIDSKRLIKKYKDKKNFDLKVTNWLNGSIIEHEGKRLFCYRMEMPVPKYFENQKLAIVELDRNWQPIESTNKLLKLQSDFGGFHVEDPRLFQVNGDLMLAYTDGYNMAIANLSKNDSGQYLSFKKKNAVGHDGREKNWTPFEYDKKVHFVYNTAPIHTVFDLDGNLYEHEWNLDFKYGYLRGGTPAYNMGDYYLSFFHSSLQLKSERWARVYFAGAYAFESKPPFKPIAYTKEPLIMGEFFDMSIARPCNVVFVAFPCGAILNKGEWNVSFGYQDYENRIFKIKDTELWNLMSYC